MRKIALTPEAVASFKESCKHLVSLVTNIDATKIDPRDLRIYSEAGRAMAILCTTLGRAVPFDEMAAYVRSELLPLVANDPEGTASLGIFLSKLEEAHAESQKKATETAGAAVA